MEDIPVYPRHYNSVQNISVQVHRVEVVALYSGVCKVNAAIAAQVLIGSFGAEIIINAGTAGGMDERLEIFDTVISTEVDMFLGTCDHI